MAAAGYNVGYTQQTSSQTDSNGNRTYQDKDGNKVTEASEGGMRIRAHDNSDQDEVNTKLFGEGATNAPRQNPQYINSDGDTVQESSESNMRVRVHDQSTEAEGNATKGPPLGDTYTYKDTEGNTVAVATDDNPGIRTHDLSDQDEVNRKLFGQGAHKGANEQVC